VASNYYEDRTMGQRLDDTIGATQQSMRSQADVVRDSVAQAAEKVRKPAIASPTRSAMPESAPR
jgi:hypothetical protein